MFPTAEKSIPMIQKSKKAGIPVSESSGKIAPKRVDVGSANDLLAELEATSMNAKWERYKLDGIKHPSCDVNCKCPPCLAGACRDCYVDVETRRGMGGPSASAYDMYRGGRR